MDLSSNRPATAFAGWKVRQLDLALDGVLNDRMLCNVRGGQKTARPTGHGLAKLGNGRARSPLRAAACQPMPGM
jgi:hypothetical protein